MGNAVWELFCLEHNITPDGQFLSERQSNDDVFGLAEGVKTFFHEIRNDKMVPRVVMVDLEPGVLGKLENL